MDKEENRIMNEMTRWKTGYGAKDVVKYGLGVSDIVKYMLVRVQRCDRCQIRGQGCGRM